MMTKTMKWCVVLMAMAGAVAVALEMPSFFTDQMVVQREAEIRVWGKAPAGTPVTVAFADVSVTATADAEGKWLAALPPLPPCSEGRDLKVAGDTEIVIHDVLVGDVWLCAGQSNMAWEVRYTDDIAPVMESAENHAIRLLKIPSVWSREPQDDVKATWMPCNPQTVGKFSSVGYLTGRELQETAKIPMGLVQLAWGGCRIEAMTKLEDFGAVPSLKTMAERIQATVADMKTKADEALRKDKQRLPTVLYNAMVHPLGPLAVKGMLWYQGEDNHYEGAIYAEKLKAMAMSWRNCFANPDMPIYIVLLPPWKYGDEDGTRIPNFWLAQRRFAETDPHSGFIVTTDCGNPDDIHPHNKIPLASRLAKLVLYRTYGIGEETSLCPTFKSACVEDGRVMVTFNCPNGLKSRDGAPLSFLQLAGEDGVFKEAQGVLEGDRLAVAAADVPTPKRIRFGWDKLANPNLVNRAGNPVMPFEEEIGGE